MSVIDVRKVIQELVVPELQEIKSEIRVIHSEIKRVDQRIDGLEKYLGSEIADLKEQTRNLREEFKLAIDMHERIATLEAKINR